MVLGSPNRPHLYGDTNFWSQSNFHSVMDVRIFSPQLCQLIQEQPFKAVKPSFRTDIVLVSDNFYHPELITVGLRISGPPHPCLHTIVLTVCEQKIGQ